MPAPTMLDRLATGQPGVLTYGVTPPKQSWGADRIVDVAGRQAERIADMPVDGVVVYDLQDESVRTSVERPFPWEEPLDPVDYAYDLLADVDRPKIVYRCVGRLPEQDLADSLERIAARGGATVLVGAASRHQDTTMRLSDAYALRRRGHTDLLTGGVLIGERHRNGHGEHERVLGKVDAGCSFFVSQAVYAASDTKDVLSDLHLACLDQGRPVPPVLVTLSPCGSERTLGFLRWLGVDVPRWIANDLLRAEDTLAASLDACERTFRDLWAFARRRDIPLGANVESVSIARAEIDASVELVHRIRAVMDAG
ncbi:5,10-methylenetetrahydrofolate reductase [Salsipaludibacter albus]|uniref:5,10-methylenetetrahydrofolate reductase n=1 Tax=Salsipaludibacter albus TaxID=2849650 RepID=UPI001EE44DCC|nr:5,10-methylenetetrahydrofolate reductase [Salsipaludibacter albus]MBY5163903.1 5,10-methylenetetrahydrofolate reductase [Salsipaludibacter albus]